MGMGLAVAACGDASRKQPAAATPHPAVVTAAPKAPAPTKALALDTVRLPDQAAATAVVLQPGVFHDGEVPPDAAQRRWLGLFRRTGGYYLAPAAVRTARVQDVIMDEEGQRTGWEVTLPRATDTCLVLLTGPGKLAAGPVDSAAAGTGALMPGQPVRLGLGGVRYTLSARCQYAADSTVRNYKLYLTCADRPGKEQLLAAAPLLDDATMTLVWAGDLDHDGRLDLILDTTSHYNASRLSVYLSGAARGAELVKFVGLRETVGC